MSEMLTEISRVVSEDISNRVSQYDVIYEAIINSIHANADSIVCTLHSYDNPLLENETQLTVRKVDTIIISDNGDGLNNENYNSFCKYRSGYKKDLGGKGVGRFTFLKVYQIVKYKSDLLVNQETRSFTFDLNFDTDNLEIVNEKIERNYTEISLSALTSQYLNIEKHIDRRVNLDLYEIREHVLLNLIPTLFFYKKKEVNIEIKFIDKVTEDTTIITPFDIPNFSEKPFTVRDKNGMDYKFILHHQIIKTDGHLHAYYCANNRTVCDFAYKDFKISLPYGYSGFLLVEADYLDSHANNDRNDFDIFPVKTDLFSTISWEMINAVLKVEISEIVKEGIPETKKVNKAKLVDIQKERPYPIKQRIFSELLLM